MEEFHVDATGVYLGADPYGVQKFDHDLNYIGQITPPVSTAIDPYTGSPWNDGQSLAYDPGRGIWFAGDNERNIYQISDTDSDGDLMDETWQYIFTHTSYAGSHHDGMEYVGGYLWISDMTSDVLGKWQYDSDTDTWSEAATYTYSEGAVVEGMGYGPNASFWIGGYGSSYVYELHGEISCGYPVADAGENVPSYPPTIPVELDGSGSYFEACPGSSEGGIVLYEWDCEGDGIYDYSGTDPATTCTYPAVYNPDGSIDWGGTAQTYTATLRVTDNTPALEGGPQTSVDTCEVHITAPPWQPVADPNGPYNPRVNNEVCLDGSGSYHPAAAMYEPGHAWYDNIVSWEWDLNNDGEFDDATGEIVCTQWSTEGTYLVCLRVTDGAGVEDVKCTTVIVGAGIHDVAVEDVTPSKSTGIVPGEEVTIDVDVSNLGDYTESFNVTLTCDSVVIGTENVSMLFKSTSVSLLFFWDTTGITEGTHTIKACADVVPGEIIVDNNCLETTTVEVTLNQPPIANPGGPYLGPLEICFDGTGSSDPDGDALAYSWNFGGNTGAGETPCHTYAEAGIYDVCLTVNDGTVDSEEVCTSAVVYDPSAGFVTGGGWIDSPEGAYKPDASLTGKANFGFVSKYKKGATAPTGQTEFQFQTGSLNFHSDSYQWLVVTGANFARFKGDGTINGENDANGNAYKFMIWAGDDTPDTFRIKIWSEDDEGNETNVYDNGFDQEISGGQIVIHVKK